MEFIVQKIGMSRTVTIPSYSVTLLKVLSAKVCKIKDGTALVAYSKGKSFNKSIAGNQKKYNLSKEYNHFATLKINQDIEGDIDTSSLNEGVRLKVTFKTKGRGFSGAMKRWNFQGGPSSHGSRFHRRLGSIGNREWPGRVQPGKKMAGHYGNEKVSVQSDVVSFDKQNNILVLKGSVSGFNGSYGRIIILDRRERK
ncbi:50S ribosomal protein L3 [Helicobacter muridarum]|uniref:50S ribosomal protein L3 n=1 Tax=Helicobacter muridarum TaxID=216 RepID=A0A099TZF6_9HELI|nr:50S ribosomal protein L3 [Helicobacter muridarum]TLE01417.1 50S ribosomal protein L3 [Helicobacter muridarum]STQ85346.1 50S ribosomal protein L3 [Helicobacter muridarum]